MILNDKQIKKLAEEENMINPFVDKLVHKGISHGLGTAGYDVRCGDEFKIFSNAKGTIIDPLNFSEDSFITVKGEPHILVPPNSFVLAASIEFFSMPRRVTGLVTGKSSYCRSGLGTPSTVLEGGWKGNLVMEFANHSNLPIKLYANSGAAQVLFFEGQEPKVSYAEGSRKYQGQTGITLAKAK